MLMPLRAVAIVGLGLTGALVHSWVHAPLVLRAPEPDPGKPLLLPPGTDTGDGSANRDPSQGTSPGGGHSAGDQGAGDGKAPGPQNPPAGGTSVPPSNQAQGRAQRVFDVRTFGTFIDFEQTKYLLQFVDSGQVTFIDARSDQAAYEAGHISGAIRLSADMFDNADARVDEFINFFDPSARYVIYCSGGDCDESENTRNRLFARGYAVTHIYKNGWDEWVTKQGTPITTGDQP